MTNKRTYRKREYIEYDGVRWHKTNGGYYRSNKLMLWLHRYTYEKYFGKISTGYIVHHINKNRNDNRIENLKTMKRGEHTILHLKGISLSDKVKKNMSNAQKGHECTEETKRKMSKIRRGKYIGKQNSFYGKRHTNETKDKLSKLKTGTKHSKETKNKIGLSGLGRHWKLSEKLKGE